MYGSPEPPSSARLKGKLRIWQGVQPFPPLFGPHGCVESGASPRAFHAFAQVASLAVVHGGQATKHVAAKRGQILSNTAQTFTDPAWERQYRGYIPELDALRTLGISAVLLNHFWPPALSPWVYEMSSLAWMAMDSFFVLSGFLITGILLDSKKRPDYYSTFYIRRSLRIFPLYYLVLAVLLAVSHLARVGGVSEYSSMARHWGSPAWFFVYLGNVRMAWMGSQPTMRSFTPLWSLQIEEQFYLLFPFLARTLSLKQLSRVLWVLVFLSPVLRLATFLWNPANPYPQIVLLPCRMDGLALGALIAVRFRMGPWRVKKIPLAVFASTLLLLTASLSLIITPEARVDWRTSAFERLAGTSLSSFGCASLILLLVLLRGSHITRWLRIAPIRFIAKISYSLFLLHVVASRILRASSKIGVHLNPNGFPRFALVIGLSFLLASLSWRFFERPFTRLKERIAPKNTSPVRTAREAELVLPAG